MKVSSLMKYQGLITKLILVHPDKYNIGSLTTQVLPAIGSTFILPPKRMMIRNNNSLNDNQELSIA